MESTGDPELLQTMLRIPPIPKGFARQWLKCASCGDVRYYDYTPHGLGNPIMWLPCGHDFGKRFADATICISEVEAIQTLAAAKKS